MIDKDVIKALERCTTNGASCKDCPAFVKVERSNCKKYFRGALALINRQQAQIKELEQRLNNIKAEAVKEFAERLKKEIDIRPTYSREQNKYVVFLIDNLAKEMIGE